MSTATATEPLGFCGWSGGEPAFSSVVLGWRCGFSKSYLLCSSKCSFVPRWLLCSPPLPLPLGVWESTFAISTSALG